MISKKKIGIYGGTFNPPHIGHIGAAESFMSAVGLDELLIMPDFMPPHKVFDSNVDPNDRLQMCNLAFSHIDGVSVSDFEINRGGKSYTAITLESFAGDDRELYFLCGSDMFLTLERWYSFEKIFELAVICLVRRESDNEIERNISVCFDRYKKIYNARIISIPIDVTEISSSELRRALKSDGDINGMLSDDVYKYIKDRGLYQ